MLHALLPMDIVRRKKGQWVSARLQRIGTMLLLLLCKHVWRHEEWMQFSLPPFPAAPWCKKSSECLPVTCVNIVIRMLSIQIKS